jgi:hypothetical protein
MHPDGILKSRMVKECVDCTEWPRIGSRVHFIAWVYMAKGHNCHHGLDSEGHV